MPSDHDLTTLEVMSTVLKPLSTFTDALPGEKEVTVSAVHPLLVPKQQRDTRID